MPFGDWIRDAGAGVVAIAAIWMFLKAFERWGYSRDAERTALLAEVKAERSKADEDRAELLAQIRAEREKSEQGHQEFLRALRGCYLSGNDAIVRLVNLAHTMVHACQSRVPPEHRLTSEDVIEAGTIARITQEKAK